MECYYNGSCPRRFGAAGFARMITLSRNVCCAVISSTPFFPTTYGVFPLTPSAAVWVPKPPEFDAFGAALNTAGRYHPQVLSGYDIGTYCLRNRKSLTHLSRRYIRHVLC